MFSLQNLLKYDNIVIQCHDYPDADALASAFAVYTYLITNGRRGRIIYSGNAEISKSNLLKMIELLSIPIEYVNVSDLLFIDTLLRDLLFIDTLVVVDCQYGESNVSRFEAVNIFQIDHHEDKNKPYDGVVRSGLGSCSTLIWDLLRAEGFSFADHPKVATALYYGLYTDSNGFEEISHPLDKDLRDGLAYEKPIINALRFNNLTVEELRIAGKALIHHKIDRKNGFAIFRADECDQNILGFISDLAIQVDGVNTSIVYTSLPNGYKFSVRSCTREIMANELAAFIAAGGGHKQKAGGFIHHDKVRGLTINQFIESLANEYFNSYDMVYAGNHSLNISAMPMYIKRRIPLGYVMSINIFPSGTPMLVRTLEGDAEISASDNILLMIGPHGEVYPIQFEKFAGSYTPCSDGFIRDYIYSPTVKNKITNEVFPLIAYAQACVPTGKTYIHAAPLERNTKVFTKWNSDSYMFGVTGDYIAVRNEDHNDVYVIKRDIFEKTYTLAESRVNLYD